MKFNSLAHWPHTIVSLLFIAFVLSCQQSGKKYETNFKGKSVAVFPFLSANSDPQSSNFTQGVTSDIVDLLNQNGDLRIISGSSVRKLAAKPRNLNKISEQLGVDASLDGIVERIGNLVRIKTELIDLATGNWIWEKTFERDIKDIFSLQNEIVAAVASSLNSVPGNSGKAIHRPTEKTEAYIEYCNGRNYWNLRSDSALRAAIVFFNKAIELDPNYAKAYSGLADCYSYMGYGNYLPPGEAFLAAEKNARKALALDSNLADPHTSLGYIEFYYYWNWNEAEREFKSAIRLDPHYVFALDAYAYFLTAREKFPQARDAIEKARALDPLSEKLNTDMGFSLYYAGDFEQSIRYLKTSLEWDPKSQWAHNWLGRVYQEKKMYNESIAEFQKTFERAKDWPIAYAAIGYVEGISGNKSEATLILERMNKLSQQKFVTPYGLALVYLGLNEKERSLDWLEKSFETKANWMVWLKSDPRWTPLYNEERFKRLVAKIGFNENKPLVHQK